MNDPKLVALIDDDDGPIRYYHDALKDAGFEVERYKSFAEALNFIENTNRIPDMWIIDIMMPISDESLEVDGERAILTTSMGLGAGLLLYKKIKHRNLAAPCLILTSITSAKLLDAIEAALVGEDRCEAKLDMVPSKLVEQVRMRIAS